MSSTLQFLAFLKKLMAVRRDCQFVQKALNLLEWVLFESLERKNSWSVLSELAPLCLLLLSVSLKRWSSSSRTEQSEMTIDQDSGEQRCAVKKHTQNSEASLASEGEAHRRTNSKSLKETALMLVGLFFYKSPVQWTLGDRGGYAPKRTPDRQNRWSSQIYFLQYQIMKPKDQNLLAGLIICLGKTI